MREQTFAIILTAAAVRQLSQISKPIQQTIREHIDGLMTNARPQMGRPLRGQEGAWRLRVGDYRVVYVIDDAAKRITIVKIAHRKDVYRGM